jgi:ribonuclease HII
MPREPAEQGSFDWSDRRLVAGIDEAGRGPLAGPVVAAAVVLDARRPIAGLADSKTLTAARREQLAGTVAADSLAWGLGWADPAEIDVLNILQATMLAMRRALLALRLAPTHVMVDGNRCPDLQGLGLRCSTEAVVKGDAKVACISAASILAKVARDDFMCRLDERYPGYGFAVHKGYPTREHLAALSRLGPAPVHRRSYAPVQSLVPLARR